MSDVLLRHCRGCEQDKPATEEYFYPSHLKDDTFHYCKTCHRAREVNRIKARQEKLVEVAQEIEQHALVGFMPLPVIAETLGVTLEKVKTDALKGEMPLFKFRYNNTGWSFALKQEDAEAYIASLSNGQHPTVTKEQVRTGRTDRCNICGGTRGGIFGDMDTGTRTFYGSLCARCDRLVQGNADPHLARLYADYLERTRGKG